MAKLESSFKNMVISLVTIAVVAAAALAGVYTLTKDKIDEQKAEKEQKAILAVLPNEGVGAFIAPADTIGNAIIYRAYTDSTFTPESFIGAAVKTSEIGFGGKFNLMVGFDADNLIVNYTVLDHQETPGLGDKMGKWFCDKSQPKRCVIGRKAGALMVSKVGGDVDAITAATISSKAFLRAINSAYGDYTGEDVDAAAGASQVKKQEPESAEVVEPETEQQIEAQTGATTITETEAKDE